MESFYVYANGGYTQLAKPIYLQGEWEVALTQIHIENNDITPKHFGITANFVDTSYVDNTTLPILRWVHSLKAEFRLPYYKRVSAIRLSHIHIKLINHELEPINCGIVDLVLHFRKK